MELDPKIVSQQEISGGPRKVKVALCSNDKVFQDLRDLNFSAVGTTLKKRALALQQIEQVRVCLDFHVQ